MKKTLIACFAILCQVGVVNAATTTLDPRVKELTREEVMALPKAQRQQYMQKLIAIKSGGFITKEGTGKGHLKIISSVPEIDQGFMAASIKNIWRVLKIDISVVPAEKAKPFSLAAAKDLLKNYKAQAGVFVVEDDEYPRLLVAHEEGWGLVNVKKCASSTEDSRDKVLMRARKEILRTLALASGAGNSGNVMQSVVDIGSLDNILVEALPLQARNAMLSHLANLGIVPVYETSYFKACKEGWAPAPTNDVQKAIWEKVKADKERGPTNPITIPPPKKK